MKKIFRPLGTIGPQIRAVLISYRVLFRNNWLTVIYDLYVIR